MLQNFIFFITVNEDWESAGEEDSTYSTVMCGGVKVRVQRRNTEKFFKYEILHVFTVKQFYSN